MLRQRKSVVTVLGLLVVAVVALTGSATASPAASPERAPTASSAKSVPSERGDLGVQACRDVTSPGGAHVTFCWLYGEGTDLYGNRLPMWNIWGTVHGASFAQVLWVSRHGQAVWQATARPSFDEYFTWAAARPKIQACNANGCSGWVSV
ncbi:MAG: hypothetical protein ACRDSK_00080 [Actinophytocola sp.]|uniref:hypothetical protein n=1 Tax=Actinophytocola sp. TaxID=1872138 RepID=UPI003D6AC04D